MVEEYTTTIDRIVERARLGGVAYVSEGPSTRKCSQQGIDGAHGKVRHFWLPVVNCALQAPLRPEAQATADRNERWIPSRAA
jgi:hypothetical protein